MVIHESSPCGPTFSRFSLECANYAPTYFYPGISLGSFHNGCRCEDLARQTFADESFDIVITQDVLEHLLEPCTAFREIARTLKPGGVHLFTVPWFYWQETKIRARLRNNVVEYLEKPEYHGNPVDAEGALVVTEWGRDLCDTIYASSGMTTTVMRIFSHRLGVEAQFIEVFVSRKCSHDVSGLLNRWGAQ
jgi:SAM-dependent methyltransferase